MSADLPTKPTFEGWRRRAKKLLRQFRSHEPGALTLVAAHHPNPERFSTLADAQLVTARLAGRESWSDLCRFIEASIGAESTPYERADLFCELACLSYSGNDHIDRRERATQLFEANPELTSAVPSAAAAAFDCDALKAFLEHDPALAIARGGPRDWPPLLYVCYSRVSEERPRRDALAAARILIDAGAPGDTGFTAAELGGWRWSALTGAMGEGENGLLQQPPHPRAREMAEMLLEAGADPNDSQGLYNTMFTPGNEWLELLLDRGLRASCAVLPGRDEIKTLDYQLAQAVKRGLKERVALLLDHGADASGTDSYSQRTNYENAVLGGTPELADLLVQYGADAVELSVADRFRAAVMRGDKEEAGALALEDPRLIANRELLFAAVDKPAATGLLLDLGADPNAAEGAGGRVPLHEAAWSDQRQVVDLLLAAGASCDMRESHYNATPVGFADHAGHCATRDVLLDHSQDVFELVRYGRSGQLRALLGRDPDQSRSRLRGGFTPLHCLRAASGDLELIIDLLLAAGAGIDAAADDGATALDAALERDDEVLAAALRSRGAGG